MISLVVTWGLDPQARKECVHRAGCTSGCLVVLVAATFAIALMVWAIADNLPFLDAAQFWRRAVSEAHLQRAVLTLAKGGVANPSEPTGPPAEARLAA
ncbi:unnamed protein product [Prorocentrum cordatum]|uniref:Uncharacterized protein n=1 Tax=Prorocentrum cordatum TaxID=2364126 RepID=A0ABN9WC62_9DINO|nr:unnamed protein product [Polarella glacialis]